MARQGLGWFPRIEETTESQTELARHLVEGALRHARKGEYDSGLALALAATNLGTEEPDAHRIVGSICLQLAALEEERHNIRGTYAPESRELSRQFLAKAVTYLREARRRGASDPATIVGLTRAHLRLNDLQTATGLEPDLIHQFDVGDPHIQVEVTEMLAELRSSRLSPCLDFLAAQERPCQAVATRIGRLLLSSGRNVDAVRFCQRVRAGANSPLTPVLATALAQSGDFDAALQELAAVESHGRSRSVHHTLATIHMMAGRPREALLNLDEALDSVGSDAALEFTKAQCLITLGRWLEAWPLWESRLRLPEFKHAPSRTPNSELRNLRDKRIYLTWEQGLGDTVLFSRFASTLAQHGAIVTLRCQPQLVRLMKGLTGVARVTSAPIPPSDYDACIPLLSVPGLLETTTESVPRDPYIEVNPSECHAWQSRSKLFDAGRLKVGLVWQGNPRYADDLRRSVNLEKLKDLFAFEDVQFFSLQKGEKTLADEGPLFRASIVDLGPELCDFVDTAAVLQQLDLLISVDTAIAHVAGAIGTPVWVMLPFASAPFWLQHQKASPLYRSATLFRQPARGQWQPVVDEVAAQLAALNRRRSGVPIAPH